MTDQTDMTLAAAIKALRDVVAPAVDRDAPQAVEQLRLVVDALEFLRARIPLLEDRAHFDLAYHLELARSVGACSEDCADTLRDAIAEGEGIVARTPARRAEVEAASAALAAALREAIRAAARAAPETRQAIERVVVDSSQAAIAVDRAWYLPQGLDPGGGDAPPVQVALAARATPG